MENLLARHRNVTILVAVLFAEVVGLAVQVKRTADTNSSRLIRVWTVTAVTPLEKAFVATQRSLGDIWHSYFYLRGVRAQNRELQDEIEQLRLQQVRLAEDAGQARRLQRLLGFKEQFIAKTLAAQVIGSSGSDMSRVVYIDKGAGDGVKQDMAVITAEGVVGKVLRIFPTSSQVLLINDPSSGVGAILEKSRLQGVIRGTPNGELVLEKMMSDERVEVGDKLLTSGGDQIFPKGLTIGEVKSVSPGRDVFLNVRVKPAAQLSRLEEVLIITQVVERQPTQQEAQSAMRAVDILAARLPSVPERTGQPSTGIPLPMGVKPAVPKATEVKPGSGAKPPASGIAAQNGLAPRPRPKPAGTGAAQLTDEGVKVQGVKPKAANGAPAATQGVGASGASAGVPATVVPRKPRPKPATGAAAPGASNANQNPPKPGRGDANSGAAGSTPPAPKVVPPPQPKPPAGTEQSPPPSTPPPETPQP
ncbi:MAG TPA: rod shape-determining protein MreC [Terriglobales bacterium]|nr:rod shape-determining protein MreC [Terriglobales bacterium]